MVVVLTYLLEERTIARKIFYLQKSCLKNFFFILEEKVVLKKIHLTTIGPLGNNNAYVYNCYKNRPKLNKDGYKKILDFNFLALY